MQTKKKPANKGLFFNSLQLLLISLHFTRKKSKPTARFRQNIVNIVKVVKKKYEIELK